jgi:hypothetical protein
MTNIEFNPWDAKYDWNKKRIELYNLAIVSSEVSGNIQVKRKESTEILNIRPTIHIAQVTPFGELKTTTAQRIKAICESRIESTTGNAFHPYLKEASVTAPVIAGSITEKGKVIPPLNVKALNGTMVIDEFKTNPNEKSEAIGAALDVLETEESHRGCARVPRKPWLNNSGSVKYEVEDGRLRFEGLRSNWFFLSARYLQHNVALSMRMLLSRTIPVYFRPTHEDLKAIDDNPDLLLRNLKLPKPVLADECIYNATYLKIRDFVDSKFAALKIPDGYYLRTINDCVRAYTFNGGLLDYEMFDFIVRCKADFISDQEKAGIDVAELEAVKENTFEKG